MHDIAMAARSVSLMQSLALLAARAAPSRVSQCPPGSAGVPPASGPKAHR